ncbi:hypothetical protein ACTFIV_003349 [Dictyostelium citrinum]
MIIYLLIILLLINSISNTNGSNCLYTNPLNGAIYDLEPMFNSSNVRYAARTSDVGYDVLFISSIFFDLCTDIPLPECFGNGTKVCQRLNRVDNGKYYNTYDLGNYYSSTFDMDGVTIRYKATVSNSVPITDRCSWSYESGKRVSDFFFKCNKNLQKVVVVSSTQPQFCYYQIYLEGNIFCNCENCKDQHSKCYNGKCSCDQYSTGDYCEQLNVKIYSITTPATSEGITFLNGDFQYITSRFQVLIGGYECTGVKLINSSVIQITLPPKDESELQNITITDGISSYYSPPNITYQYPPPCLYNCSPPHGECNFFTSVCTCDSQTNGTGCENNRINLDSIDPTDENGGTTYLYGYFGITTRKLVISIGGSECINIQQINETLIKCEVVPGTGFKDVLLQDRDLQIRVTNLFQYFVPITTNSPKQCLNDCGGPNRGICLASSGCSCISPWIGNDCMSKIVTIPQPPTIFSNPSTEITFIDISNNTNNEIDNNNNNKLFQSVISIVKLREIDQLNQKEFNSFELKEWIITQINTHLFQYQTKINNSDSITDITVTSQWFNNQSIIEFANQTIKINPSSIKYTIKISNYKFSNKQNKLQLVMKASISVNKTNDNICPHQEFGETSNGDDSNYLKVQVDNHSLYGRLIKRALIDSIPRSIENIKLDSSSSSSSLSTSTSSLVIGITVPFFKNEIIIDPDFSLLVGSIPNPDNPICSLKTNSSNSLWIKNSISTLYTIIVCGFFGIVAISTIVIFSYLKVIEIKNLKSIGQLSTDKTDRELLILKL